MSNIAKRNANAVALPAHLAELFGGMGGMGDLTSGVSVGFPVVSIKGKVFHIKRAGEVELVTKPDDPDEPATSLEIVLLKANPKISKTYYADGFEDGTAEKPTCYSNDGMKPADDAEAKQAKNCATCPQNQWGARVTDSGKRAKACQDVRRVAIAAAGALDDPMLLRVPAASLKPLMQYGSMLEKKGIPYQVMVTKLGFDHSQAYPLLTFKHVRLVDQDQAVQIKETIEGEVVEAIINGGGAQQMADEEVPVKAEDEGDDLDKLAAQLKEREQPKAAATKKATAPAPKKPAVSEDDVASALSDEDEAAAAQAAAAVVEKAAKPAATPKPKTAAAAATATVVDDDMESALDKLLGDFDDE
jgi:hypothetical protein